MKYVTIKDIASRLNLSVSTVSRGLSDDKSIRLQTRQKIQAVADEMGYKRNKAAALLRTGRTNTVGVVVNEMLTPFASRVLEGIQAELQSAGYQMQIANSREDPQQERRNLQLMENSFVDGIIVAPCHGQSNVDEFQGLLKGGHPMVFFARSIKNLDVSKVVSNDNDKAYFLTEHLIRSGRKRIVHVKGPDDVSNFVDIYRGYTECLRHFGLKVDPELVVESALSVTDGQLVADRLVDSGIEFDAVFACTDILAIGVMNRLRQLGYDVPGDVAVAGFSGSPLSEMVYPALTTVEPPHFEMGVQTARLLLDQIEAETPQEPRTVVLDSKICLRASTCLG